MEWEEKVYLCKGIIRDLSVVEFSSIFIALVDVIPLINSHETVETYRSSAVTLKKSYMCLFFLEQGLAM